MAYIGKAALTLVRADSSLVYVYAGEPVPGGADEADVARLVEEGFIVPVGEPDEVPADESTDESVPAAKKTAAPRRA